MRLLLRAVPFAIAGSELRKAREASGPARRSRRIRVDPRGDGAARGGGANGACNAREANAAGARLHFHRAGHIHDANATATGLRAHGTADFTKIDLAAAGAHADQVAGLPDGDIAAVRLQIGAAPDLTRANVADAAAAAEAFLRSRRPRELPWQ